MHFLESDGALAPLSNTQKQAPALHIARGLYHRSGIAPCPEGCYLIDVIISFTAYRVHHTWS